MAKSNENKIEFAEDERYNSLSKNLQTLEELKELREVMKAVKKGCFLVLCVLPPEIWATV